MRKSRKAQKKKPATARGSAKSREECLSAFVRIVGQVERGKYAFKEGAAKEETYYIVNERGRQGSDFVHVVPADSYRKFEEARKVGLDSFLGFSVLAGKVKGRDVRVSCFGIPTPDIMKALISRK